MADSSFGANPITTDLTVTGARVLREAPERIKLKAVEISGDPGAGGTVTMILRQDSASGQVVWQHKATASVVVNQLYDFSSLQIPLNGLYFDGPTVAWTANSWIVVWYE